MVALAIITGIALTAAGISVGLVVYYRSQVLDGEDRYDDLLSRYGSISAEQAHTSDELDQAKRMVEMILQRPAMVQMSQEQADHIAKWIGQQVVMQLPPIQYAKETVN